MEMKRRPRHEMNTRLAALLALAAIVFAPAPLRAESETDVKAAYLFNFAKLIDWPASAFAGAKAPIVIGVVGRDSVGDELARNIAGATANGRPVEVRRVSAGDGAALRSCHVVFIPGADRGDGVITAVQGSPVLLVGESDGFARRGGAIGFVKVNDAVKFDVNPKAAARSGLNVSSKLLRVAREVIN